MLLGTTKADQSISRICTCRFVGFSITLFLHWDNAANVSDHEDQVALQTEDSDENGACNNIYANPICCIRVFINRSM